MGTSRIQVKLEDNMNDINGTVNEAPARSKVQLTFLQSPLVLAGEDSAEYDQLLESITECLQPRDIFQKIMVSDLAYYIWSSFRDRRTILRLIEEAKQLALATVLRPLYEAHRRPFRRNSEVSEPCERLALRFVLKNPEDIKEVNELLEKAGLNMSHVEAVAISMCLKATDHLQQMSLTADSFRHALLREYKRYGAASQYRDETGEREPPQLAKAA
jgi:hypothetical protein